MSWSLVISGLAALAACIAAAIAFAQARTAKASTDAAERSAAAAERSTNASERSAQVAERSLEIQRREADAAAEARRLASLADVRAVEFDPRSRAGLIPGLHVRNYGQGRAEQLRVYLQTSSTSAVQRAVVSQLAPDEMTSVLHFEDDGTPWDDSEIPKPQANEVAARVFWANGDGSPGDSGWALAPRLRS